MKTLPRNSSWHVLTSKFNEFWLKGSSLQKRVLARSEDKKNLNFRTWTPIIPHVTMLGKERPKIDVPVLERFIKEFAREKLSAEALIASHLQRLTEDATSIGKAKKSLAVQRMVALVSKTLEDMKKIENHAIAKSQG